MAKFTADIDAWVQKSKSRLKAVALTATSGVIEEIVDRTPVDTGFLRNSIAVSLNVPVPIGGSPNMDMSAIAGLKIGDTIYATFTANYARPIEYGFRSYSGARMVGLSIQNWQAHFDYAIKKAKAHVKG